MLPACGRCTKRNKPDGCVYHPAPLTKASNGDAAASEAMTPRINSFAIAFQSPSSRESAHEPLRSEPKRVKLTQSYEAPQSFAGFAAQPTSYSQDPVDTLRKPVTESLSCDDGVGFINQSAVLAENELSIGILPPNEDAVAAPRISQAQIDRGATVLTLFKDLPAITKYIDK